MREDDLDAALHVVDAAFAEQAERTSGRRATGPRFSPVLGRYRLALDPDGCHVALRDDEIVGANFSILRGTLGWFGPLAVRTDSQGLGIAQRLVGECLRSADRRGARLMGLETFAASSQHIHLYQKLGFRPSWTGISYSRDLDNRKIPAGVVMNGSPPNLDYVYPGFDASKDALTTAAQNVGATLTVSDGYAVCHVTSTLWADMTVAYVPLIAARDRKTFDVLLSACEALAGEQGKVKIATQVPGSSWHTQEAMLEHGYRPGGAALRMKRGADLDYEAAGFYYCDDWH